jgi:hypothetical protein
VALTFLSQMKEHAMTAESSATRQAECGTWRGKMQILVFDLWRDGVLTEQQCAAYTGEDLVQVRRLLDCEAAKRGYKCREDAQT